MGYTVLTNKPGTTPGGLTRSLGDTVATNAGTSGGKEENGSDNIQTKNFFDKLGEVCEIGRGETDTDITYIALRNASGTKVYIHPDAAGTAITVTPTKP